MAPLPYMPRCFWQDGEREVKGWEYLLMSPPTYLLHLINCLPLDYAS